MNRVVYEDGDIFNDDAVEVFFFLSPIILTSKKKKKKNTFENWIYFIIVVFSSFRVNAFSLLSPVHDGERNCCDGFS